tara:strand:+ start:501 stop:1094 length:594 start_codon:yes stop_codon:yes gene_type:complete
MILTTSGIREDALLFMDTTVVDWVLSSSFTYDCEAGFALEFGNQNGGGGPESIDAFLQVEAYVNPCLDPVDFDFDGFLNAVDTCPYAFGVAALNGCPWPVYVGNNFKPSVVSSSIEIVKEEYLCSRSAAEYYNIAYHSGANPEPIVGDYLIYNNKYSFPHSYVFGTAGFAYVKLRDFDKIIEVRKTDGEIVAQYNCP